MSSFTPHSPKAVLEHLDWVKGLAKQLCADASLADDVTQEALLAAVGQAPPDGLSVRRWLGGIVRNHLRQILRSEQRRKDREWLAATSADAPAASDVVERAAVQRIVVDRVLALKEPYRSALLLRYFEERSPTKIARLTGVPVPTVKTRLRRGLEQLRLDMDSEFGSDGRTWVFALLPILPKSGAASVVATGVLAMSMKPFLVGLPVVLLAVAAAVFLRGRDADLITPDPATRVAPAVDLAVPPASKLAGAGNPQMPERMAVAAPREEEVRAPQVAIASTIEVHARVFDLNSKPVAGVQVEFHDTHVPRDGTIMSAGLALGVTDEEGLLKGKLPPKMGYLYVRDARHQTLIEGAVSANGTLSRATIVVAPPCAVHGRVVNESGEVIDGATVTYTTGSNLFTDLDVGLDRTSGASWVAVTDSAGAFHLDRVPQLPKALLRASMTGYLTRGEPLPGPGDHDVELVLTRLSQDADVLLGQVFDPYGSVVEGAYVAFGQRAVRSDEQGIFQMDLIGSPDNPTLHAVKEGYLPGSFTLAEGEKWPSPLNLVLGTAPFVIEGCVLSEDRQPRADVKVTLVGATEFGWITTGSPTNPNLVGASVEDVLAGVTERDPIETDEQGRFRVEGLLPQSYRLQVSDPATLQIVLSQPIAAGSSQVEVLMPAVENLVDIVGRVTDAEGLPLARVSVALSREIEASRFESRDDLYLHGPSIQTDEDGRFQLENLIADGVRLFLFPSKQYVAQRLSLKDFDDPGEIEITLLRNAELRVALVGDPSLADSFELRDTEEEPAFMQLSEGTGAFWVKEGWFSEGRSGVYMVPEGNFIVVLLMDGEEVARTEVKLQGGEVRQVEF